MKNSLKQRHVRRSELQIRALLREKEKNNTPVKEFCTINEISEATFYNWRNRCGPEIKKRSAFMPLAFSDVVSGSLFAEIEFSGEVTVRLFEKVDPTYFKALLQS